MLEFSSAVLSTLSPYLTRTTCTVITFGHVLFIARTTWCCCQKPTTQRRSYSRRSISRAPSQLPTTCISSLSFLCLSLSFCLCLRSHNYLRRSCANYCQWKIDVIWALRQATVKVRIHFKLKYTLWLYSWLHNQVYKWLLKKFWIFIQSNMPHRLLSTRLLSVMQWRHERRVRTAQALLGWAHLQGSPNQLYNLLCVGYSMCFIQLAVQPVQPSVKCKHHVSGKLDFVYLCEHWRSGLYSQTFEFIQYCVDNLC